MFFWYQCVSTYYRTKSDSDTDGRNDDYDIDIMMIMVVSMMMANRMAWRATKILVFLQNIYKMVLDKRLEVKKWRNPFGFLSVYSSAEQFGWEEFAIIAATLI